jgi:oxygen-dependent protoporphyrinogen oxidase
MKHVTVIGAGFSGLTLARALLKRGAKVTVLEKTDRAGGMIRTLRTPNGLIEMAAPSFTLTDRVLDMLHDLQVEVETPSKAATKRLFFRGRLKSWPLTFFQTIHLVFRFFVSKIRGSLKPRSAESLVQWGERCLTSKATHHLVAPALQGIYAGDAKRLSATLLLQNLFRKDREKFRGVASVKGGMENVVAALQKQIVDKGGEIRFGVDIAANDLPQNCVFAVPPWEVSEILKSKESHLSQRLSFVQKCSLISVTIFFREPTGPKAFGCLVPRGEGLRVLGVLLNHAIFPQREGLFSETWIFGGATDPEILALSDEAMKKLIFREREIIFSKTDIAENFSITRWPQGLPHYDLILEDILKDLSCPQGIWLHGNWMGGIGLSKILERSDRLAETIVAEIK